MKYAQTPSQTVGPYFAYGLTPEEYGYPFRTAYGPVLADAMIEIRHADARGKYVDSAKQAQASGFTGAARAPARIARTASASRPSSPAASARAMRRTWRWWS